jgi:hypothetical protein
MKIEDISDKETYAILKPVSITIPGDERSRTNPGHGYPEHTVEYWDIQLFENRDKLEAEINRLAYSWNKYKVVIIKGMKVTTEIKIHDKE